MVVMLLVACGISKETTTKDKNDGVNNHCECESHSKIHPSDLYIKMLNEPDEMC